MNLEPFLAELKAALEEAGRLGAVETHLEEMRKVVLARETAARRSTMGVGDSENAARSGEAYIAHLAELDRARHAAVAASAKVEYLKTRWETWRTTRADARQRRGED